MTKNKLLTSESGLAHLGLILILIAVIGVTGFAGYRVVTSTQKDEVISAYEEGEDAEPTDDSSALNTDDESADTSDEQGVQDGDI